MRITRFLPAFVLGGLLLGALPAGAAPEGASPAPDRRAAEQSVELSSGRAARIEATGATSNETSPIVGDTTTTRYLVRDGSGDDWRVYVERIGGWYHVHSVSAEGEATLVVLRPDQDGLQVVEGPTKLGAPKFVQLTPSRSTARASRFRTANFTSCGSGVYEARRVSSAFGYLVDAWLETLCTNGAYIEHLQSINGMQGSSWVSRGSTTYFRSYNPVTYFDSHNYWVCHAGLGLWRQVATVWASNQNGSDTANLATSGAWLACDTYYTQ